MAEEAPQGQCHLLDPLLEFWQSIIVQSRQVRLKVEIFLLNLPLKANVGQEVGIDQGSFQVVHFHMRKTMGIYCSNNNIIKHCISKEFKSLERL